jgi:hypothetical protein
MVDRFTIAYEKSGTIYKLCKVIFGADGSYYVTAPYHGQNRAALFKATINFNKQVQTVAKDSFIDVAVADDDDQRIKLSHHPDGFLQFSGKGIISGPNANGISIKSWSLGMPAKGPAFGITIRGIDAFKTAPKVTKEFCVFRHDSMYLAPDINTFHLEAYYFSSPMRRFIRKNVDGEPIISVSHPNGTALPLKVLVGPNDFISPGFLAVELYATNQPKPLEDSSFTFSSSTGNLRKNEKGELLGDGLYCIYPSPPDMENARSLNFPGVQSPS